MTARVTSPLFIGRGSELKALDDALSDAEAGRPTGVLLSGDAGVGKSRLLDEFALHAESRGARMVFGHCVEAAEGELPYAPFSAALRALAADLDSDELDRVLGPTRSGLGLLVPDLGASRRAARRLPTPARLSSSTSCSAPSAGSPATGPPCSCSRTSTGPTARPAACCAS